MDRQETINGWEIKWLYSVVHHLVFMVVDKNYKIENYETFAKCEEYDLYQSPYHQSTKSTVSKYFYQ